MKLLRTLSILLAFAGVVFGAESSIEFRGVMTGGEATKLSLVDRSTDTARWVEIGQTFAGFTVQAYDPAKETATLTQNGKELRLRLKSAKLAETGPAAAAAKISVEDARKIYDNLRRIVVAADQYMMETGWSVAPLPELVGPQKYIKELKPVDGEDYATLRPRQGADVYSVVTQSGATVTWGGNEADWLKIAPPAMPPMQPAAPPYVVKPGDTAAKLAAGAGMSVTQLKALNPGVDFARLKIGQSLQVP